jgi:hypothetical protein
MKRDTSIEHKEAVIVCEESGPINLSYNALLTTLEANIVAKLIVLVIIKSHQCANYGKTCHTLETCHNKKIEAPVVSTAMVKLQNM